MKKILTIVCLFVSMFCVAQHCPFDNSGLLVVKVIDKNTKQQLKNVTPYIKAFNKEGKEVFNKSFDVNPKVTLDNWEIKGTFHDIRFEFAKNNFICTLSYEHMKNPTVVIGIKDHNGKDLNIKHVIKHEDVFSLCPRLDWTKIVPNNNSETTIKDFNKTIVLEV